MKTFPILSSYGKDRQEHERLGAPTSVPWDLVAPHEEQAQRNHGQSLQRLAERGGLSLPELAAVVDNRRWSRMELADALAIVRARLAAFEASR